MRYWSVINQPSINSHTKGKLELTKQTESIQSDNTDVSHSNKDHSTGYTTREPDNIERI